MKRTLFISIFATLLLSSCKKDKEYVIQGSLVYGCNGQPITNCVLTLYQMDSVNTLSQTSGFQVGQSVTDANGKFSFSYQPKNNRELKIRLPAGFNYATILDRIPAGKNLYNQITHANASTVIQVSLDVSNSHTSNDTLYITNYLYPVNWLKIPGPFHNGVLYTVPNYQATDSYSPVNSQFPLRYSVNNSAWQTKDFELRACDTSRVAADIN